jgi:hypothetical protein
VFNSQQQQKDGAGRGGRPSSTSNDALGEMDLDNGFHFVDVVTRSDRPKECTLILGTRMLSLKAETDVEMDMWLEAFAAIRTQWENRMREERVKKEKKEQEEKEQLLKEAAATTGPTTTKSYWKKKIKIRKGVLVKRGDFRRTWKARYFVLNEIGLAYYAKQNDDHPKRLIEYRSISGSPGVTLSWIRPHALKIHVVGDGYGGSSTKSSNNRTYYMHTRSNMERDSWIRDISHNINIDRQRNLDRGTMARVDATVGQKGRVLVAQLYAQSKKKQRRKSAVGHTQLLMANSSLSTFGGVDDQVIKNRQKKITRLIAEENVPNYDVWNHLDDVDPSSAELSDHCHQNNGGFMVGGSSASGSIGNAKVDGWCQLECWLKCEHIHIGDKYYTRANRPGRRAIRRVSSAFSTRKAQSTHAGLRSATSWASNATGISGKSGSNNGGGSNNGSSSSSSSSSSSNILKTNRHSSNNRAKEDPHPSGTPPP